MDVSGLIQLAPTYAIIATSDNTQHAAMAGVTMESFEKVAKLVSSGMFLLAIR
jgi:hypothetical protein